MTDNTTYTLEAASPEGMLTVLPCYLDHIFFPVRVLPFLAAARPTRPSIGTLTLFVS